LSDKLSALNLSFSFVGGCGEGCCSSGPII
jgi:hypothetical protein